MYISELDLHGFKSFAHKTKVTFDSGITAIVGPNGCGKSNIVDALRWVLGEQRPTLLRSASMSNVIFNGSAGKKALGMAEVSLTLINDKGLLPTEYNEVTITRRLYRSGESEYLINNTTCRLKDIMDLFMDTGMGADAYSVIELKMVEDILNDRNNDRRRLFEEAAGVTRYKERRRLTLRKLEETLKDLQRVEDILTEVRRKTRSLELQAEKAEKAKRFRTELEQLDKAYNRHEYDKIQAELEPLEERIAQAGHEKSEIDRELQKLETLEEKTRQELIGKERAEAEIRQRVQQLADKIREKETGLRITREKIENEESVIRRYLEDKKQSTADLDELTSLKEQHGSRLKELARELERSEKSLRESRERFNEVQQNYTRIRHRLYELEIEAADHGNRLSELQSGRIRLESKLESTEDDLQRIQEEVDDLNERIDGMQQEREELQSRMKQLIRERNSRQGKLEGVIGKKRELELKRDDLKEEIRKLRSECEALDSEKRLMEELAESKELFPSSVAWLDEHHARDFSRLEVVGNLFHTDERHAPALEAALGETIHFLVVDKTADALKAATILREKEQGRATFIPLSELRSDSPVHKHSILGVVRMEEAHRPLANLLLGSVILAEDIPRARRLLEMGGSAAVTPEGDLITSDRFFRGGSKSRQAGARLGLRDKLDKLASRLEQTGARLGKREQSLKQLEEKLAKTDPEVARRSLAESEQAIREGEQAMNGLTSGIEVYKKSIEDLENRRKSLLSSGDSAREELGSISPKEEKLQKKIDSLTERQHEEKKTLEELEEERAIAQNRFNDARLSHQNVKNQAENLQKDLQRAEAGIEGIGQRLRTREDLMQQSREQIAAHEKAILRMDEELDKFRSQKKELDAELLLAEKSSAAARGEIRDLDLDLKKCRSRKDVNLELQHHLEMAREKLGLKAQSLSDHIWEQYGLLMKQIDEQMPEDVDPETARERISSLRQKVARMGEVNPLAIEEFEEESERLRFLEEQVNDLLEAERQLRETINEINETATRRFNETFEKIRTNFISVFGTLFEKDDYCDLLIEQESEDPLEAKIEIKANPRGKRPSGISQLSGGEKTLTAIALLFAIYLVKPSPFCVLDEVDAPLDDANIERFSGMIRNFSEQTQFIIITHNKKTMSKAEMMYGVTMPDTGVSRLVGVRLDEVAAD